MLNRPITIPLAPHIPGGLVTPAKLRAIADVAEKYSAVAKIAGNSIVILGLSPESHASALAELNSSNQTLSAKAVRTVATCAGKPHCRRAIQDSTALGLELDAEFYGLELPGKLRIGVSGCPNSCSEVYVKDIGLVGVGSGFNIVVGGNSGVNAKPGTLIAKNLSPHAVPPLIRRVIEYYHTHGIRGERIGNTIHRLGFEHFEGFIGTN